MGLAIHSHRLGDVERYVKTNPHLRAPSRHDRESLEPGDLAMLLDELSEETEPLWTEIGEVLGPGIYLGRTQLGTSVEFDARHIADFERRPFLGAWYDVFRPAQPRQRPSSIPKPFSHFAPRPRRTEAPRVQPQPQAPKPAAKGSFFDAFRGFFGKKKATLEPIPPGERRPERTSFLRLPGPPPPPGSMAQFEEEIQEPAQGMTVRTPEKPLPDDLFSVLAPEVSKNLPQGPVKTQELIVGPSPSLPAQVDAFSILDEPAAAATPQSMVVREESLPAQADAFSILEPEQRSLSVPGEYSPFDILEEAPSSGLVVRAEGGALSTHSVFDILPPEDPATAPPEVPMPAAVVPLEEQRREKSPRPSERKQKKSGGVWKMPGTQEWIQWLKTSFDLPYLWKYIDEERNTDFFRDLQENGEEQGNLPLIPIETQGEFDLEDVMSFFGIPESVYGSYLARLNNDDDTDDVWLDINENLLYPLSVVLDDAFEQVKPGNLPGRLVLEDSPVDGSYGLFYYEPLSESDRKKIEKKRQEEHREEIEAAKHRNGELKKIWGKMPGSEELVPWIEERFDLDSMFSDIKKHRKTKKWKSEKKDDGEASMTLETVSDIGRKRSRDYAYDIASYFGIPPDVVALYESEDSEQLLWSEVFWPFFDHLTEAFSMLLPYADLPGTIVVEEDDEDHLTLQYHEAEEE